MNKTQVHEVAKIAAVQVLSSVTNHIGNLVMCEIEKSKPEETLSARPISRREYWPEQAKPPKSNFTKVMMESINWRRNRGERLAYAYMFKPSTSEMLLIEQYGTACSLLLMDRGPTWKRTVMDAINQPITIGDSPWSQFATADATLEQVVAMQKKKGWHPYHPVPKQQLELAVSAT